jgi:hypothetical protein
MTQERQKPSETVGDNETVSDIEQARSGRQYRVSADRTSASRKVRYVEGSRPDAENCRICQISS